MFIVVLAGCHKISGDGQLPVSMKDVQAPSGFEWNTARIVDISMHNIPAKVIRISSDDQSVLYRKFMGSGGTAEETITIALPAHVHTIRIDTTLVSVSSSALDFTFPPTFKSSLVNTNYALNFNGTSDWIKVPGGSSLVFTTACSMSAWVNAKSYQTAKIIERGDWDGFGLGLDYWNGWQVSFAFTDGTSTNVTWGLGRPVLNQWYHVVGTYDGATIRLYVNGVLKTALPMVKTLRNNTRVLSIGSDAGNQKFFGGLIDEVSIWTKTLTDTQIYSGMTLGFSPSDAGLKGYWKFDEGSGSVAYDSSPDNYSGTLLLPQFNTEVGYGSTSDADADGVPNSYDDYPNDPLRAFNNYFPATGFGSLAFEDLWPGQGDYDFNDLVVNYRFNTVTNGQNKIVESYCKVVTRAIGASMDNGFGFQFPSDNIPSTAITCSGSDLQKNYITLASNGLEAQQNKPTVIVFDDAFNELPRQSGFSGVNVFSGNPYVTPDTVTVHLTYTPGTYTLGQAGLENFNPFLIVNKNRGREVHLPDHAPTALADASYFGTMNDNSAPSLNRYYKTKNNLPWAINTYSNFDYATEKSDILSAYLKMGQWAESGGMVYPDWYLNLSGYRNTANIYSH